MRKNHRNDEQELQYDQNRRLELDRSLLVSQIHQLEERVSALSIQSGEMESYIIQLDTALSTRVPESRSVPPKERVKRIIEDVNMRYKGLHEMVQRYDYIVDDLKRQLSQKDEQMDGTFRENETLLQEKAYLSERIKMVQEQLNELSANNTDIDALRKTNSELKEKNSDLLAKIDSLEKGIKTSQQTFSKKQSDYEKEIGDLKKEVETLKKYQKHVESEKKNGSDEVQQSKSTTEINDTSTRKPQSSRHKDEIGHINQSSQSSHSGDKSDDTSEKKEITRKESSSNSDSSVGSRESKGQSTSSPSSSKMIEKNLSNHPDEEHTIPASKENEKTFQKQHSNHEDNSKTQPNQTNANQRVVSNHPVSRQQQTTPMASKKPVPPNQRIGAKLTSNKTDPKSLWIRLDKANVYPDIHDEISSKVRLLRDRIWYVLHVMGAYGVSTREDISEKVRAVHSISLKPSEFSQFVPQLEAMELIQSHSISSARTSSFFAYELTRKGMKWWSYLHDDELRPSEPMVFQREHDNVLHGYFIKETKKTLEEIGYTNVSMDRKANTIPLGDRQWIPDIIAISPAGQKVYVEVEHGNHIQNDMDDKINKASYVTKEVYFVGKDNEGVDKIGKQISRWYFSEMARQNDPDRIVFYLSNLRNLMNKKTWGNPFIAMPPERDRH